MIERYPPEVKAHALRVARLAIKYGYGEGYKMVSLLHDILEDTETSAEEIPIEYREDVVTLTRKDTETYFEYINRVAKGSKRAIIVKLFDIEDHLSNKETLPKSLEKRYLKAKKILERSEV